METLSVLVTGLDDDVVVVVVAFSVVGGNIDVAGSIVEY